MYTSTRIILFLSFTSWEEHLIWPRIHFVLLIACIDVEKMPILAVKLLDLYGLHTSYLINKNCMLNYTKESMMIDRAMYKVASTGVDPVRKRAAQHGVTACCYISVALCERFPDLTYIEGNYTLQRLKKIILLTGGDKYIL